MSPVVALSALPYDTLRKVVSPWLVAVENKDLAVVISHPGGDAIRRFNNLTADKGLQAEYLKFPNKIVWIPVDFRVDQIDNSYDLEKFVADKMTDSPVLVAFGCDKLITYRRTDILNWMTQKRRSGGLRFILFFESDIYSKEASEVFGQVASFQPKIIFSKLYEKNDVLHFIKHKEEEWSFKVPSGVKEKIWANCGGSLLFVKTAIWFLRDNQKATAEEAFTSKEMLFALFNFWAGFSKSEQFVLERLATNQSVDETKYSSSLDYLSNTGIIYKSKGQYSGSLPILSSYIRETTQGVKSLYVLDNQLMISGVPVEETFSKNEKVVLKYLVANKRQIVDREKVAVVMWGEKEGEKYSDWAIDSTISRLRKKLIKLGLKENLLVTKKGEGIIFNDEV